MGYLTGPVNTLTDFQVEYNGVLLGPGTAYGLPPVWQFLDMAPIKTMDQARDWADGSYSGPDFADVVMPSMDIEITGTSDSDFAAAVSAFRNLFAPMADPVPLWVKLPGMPVFGAGAKTNKRAVPIDITWGQLSIASVQWRIVNPVWQSVTRTAALGASSAAVSGLVFPLFNTAYVPYSAVGASLDFGATGTASPSVVLTNVGNTEAWPYVEVTGPCPFGFSLVMDGNIVTYGDAIPAGMMVAVDYKTGLATLYGSPVSLDRTYLLTSRQFSSVSSSSSSTILFFATSGSAVVYFADLWR